MRHMQGRSAYMQNLFGYFMRKMKAKFCIYAVYAEHMQNLCRTSCITYAELMLNFSSICRNSGHINPILFAQADRARGY